MPHSAASLQRKLEHQSWNFLYELRVKLWQNDRPTLDKFHTIIAKYRDAPPNVVVDKINACLRKYPTFCNRVTGFHPDGNLKLKTTITTTPPVVTPPSRFSDDILACLMPFLPFPLVGRLAKTCRWMNTHITSSMVEQALARARERFGRVEVFIDEPSHRHMLRIYSTEDEMITVGRLCDRSPICILKTQDRRTFIGISHDMAPGPLGRFAVLSDVIAHATATGPDAPSVWFRHTIGECSHESVTLTFIMIRDGDPYSALCMLRFDEFVR
jgi:hypothetical protein